MKVSKDSWHFKLYKFATLAKAKFQERDFWEDWYNSEIDTSRINLCPYIRRPLVVMPLIILANIIAYVMIGIVAFWLPASTVGLGNFYSVIGVVLAGSLILILSVFLFSKLAEAGGEAVYRAKETTTPYRNLLGEYYLAVKHKICPIIEVSEDTEDDSSRENTQ